MTSVHPHELEPPATVLDDVARRRIADHVALYGAACVCGEPANDAEVEVLLDEIHRDPEPVPFVCDRCAGCTDCGGDHAAGSAVCPWEVGG